jgi:MtN3 and saliva related transmembrane protein
MDYISAIGFLAGTVSVVSFIPQAARAWRTRSTGDLSTYSYTMLVAGSILWTSYGLLKQELPIILPNILVLMLISSILVAKFRFK